MSEKVQTGPKKKRIRAHPKTGRVGAHITKHTAEAVELVADLIGSWLTRRQIIAAYGSEVEARRRAREMDEEMLEVLGAKERARAEQKRSAFPLQPRSDPQIDDYIRAAKDRLAAESSPGMKAEVRAKATKTYGIVTQRLLAGGDHEAAARVVEKATKLFGLVIERQKVETVGGAVNEVRDLSDEQLEAILGGD
jgi:hypothetical protein